MVEPATHSPAGPPTGTVGRREREYRVKVSGAEFEDSRSEFLGHADILLSESAPRRGETDPSEMLERYVTSRKRQVGLHGLHSHFTAP